MLNSKKYRQEITKESEILLFGKFKYKTIQHVLKTEPSYILWIHEEKIVKFPKKIIQKAQDLEDDERMNDAMNPDGVDWGLDFGRDD